MYEKCTYVSNTTAMKKYIKGTFYSEANISLTFRKTAVELDGLWIRLQNTTGNLPLLKIKFATAFHSQIRVKIIKDTIQLSKHETISTQYRVKHLNSFGSRGMLPK